MKFPLIFVFLTNQKNFFGTQKQVRISHSKQAISVRAIKVWLYRELQVQPICFIIILAIEKD